MNSIIIGVLSIYFGKEFEIPAFTTISLNSEDLDKYPRKDEADKEICRLSGVDILFFPTADDVYGADEASVLAPKVRGFVLEGATRPSHFNGVLTVVMKLLNIVSPTRAYFGKKDAQQLLLIESMVREFFMSVKIVAVDTVRQKDGLALSSRNVYLNAQEQVEALKIPLSLRAASAVVSRGNLNAKAIKQAALEALSGLDVCYVEVLDRRLGVVETITLGDALILVEARVGNTRLLDNIWL